MGFRFCLDLVQLVSISTLFWSLSEGSAFSGHNFAPIVQQISVGFIFLFCFHEKDKSFVIVGISRHGGFENQKRDLEVGSASGTGCWAVPQGAVHQNETDLQSMAAPALVSWWTAKKYSKPECVHIHT